MKKLTKININQIMSSEKTRNIFLIIGLVAIVLIFISSLSDSANDNKEYLSQNSLSTNEYCENLTLQLTNMIESIEGAGRCKVLLTLNNSYEYIYLDDDKTLTKIIEPTVRGVVIACDGGNDPVIQERITQLITTALSVKSSSVTVTKLI